MYVERNIDARSFNHCCGGKATSITYSECVFRTIGSQHAMRMHRIVVCGLPGATIFLHIITQTAQFLKKKMLLNIKYVF